MIVLYYIFFICQVLPILSGKEANFLRHRIGDEVKFILQALILMIAFLSESYLKLEKHEINPSRVTNQIENP